MPPTSFYNIFILDIAQQCTLTCILWDLRCDQMYNKAKVMVGRTVYTKLICANNRNIQIVLVIGYVTLHIR